MYKARIRAVVIFSFIMLMTSCSSVNSTVGGWLNLDTDLKLTFQVDSDINPDESQRPSPLFIRMYELKSTRMFSRADFISIYERDKEVLGADMLGKQRLKRLKPGENRNNDFVLNKETRYIGLFAEFLQYRNSGFKVIIPVVQNNVIGTTAKIHVSGNRIYDMDSKSKHVSN